MSAAAAARPPRVALLSPYWSFFEPNVPFDLRADRRALADAVAATLARAGVEVVARPLADGRDAARDAAEQIAAAGPDALVVVQSMAVPPAFALAALDRLPRLPLVVYVASRSEALADGFSHADITADGATVGGPQLTSTLTRRGRPYALVAGCHGVPADDAELAAQARAAAAAGRLRRARVGCVGTPIDGYDCVDCDAGALAEATGVELVPIDPAAVQEAYRGAAAAAVAAVEAETRAGWRLAAGVEDGECLARSVRFAAALERLDDELALDAGAMNCHVPEIRFAEAPGITPCFALGRETSRGVPWSCAGDVVTAVALLAAKLLGGAALYHEIEALDRATGEALLANSGEHDLAWRPTAAPAELRRNVWWDEADPRCGACACFPLPPGPATLVAFAPHPREPSGFRFVVAEGMLSGRALPQTGTPHGAFRFGDGGEPVARAWRRWALAGANHHSAATRGHRGAEVAAVAAHLGVGVEQVA